MAKTPSREERIRQIAHRIWEQQGRPHGRHDEHWQKAADLVAQEENQGTALEENPVAEPKRAGRGRRAAADTSPSRPASLTGPAPVGGPPGPPAGTVPQSDMEEPAEETEIPKKPRGSSRRTKTKGNV